ncbi:glycoside hydrolase family 19 protein [Pandoraea fibrosis]|uniref:Chitinase n=1 Tax=Pandoraea fibrosis TaxID=1891094 RepID=A0A5E4W3Z1_9BURK|nr:glycoside hydrolase family 19 protein [Pandoraea fibrosis]VVE19647.1 hypothetical protein PFI31113_03039 [Pandoraea fibrosis]
MTTNSSPHPASPTPATDTKVKRSSFGFPFLKKGNGQNASSSQFADEHEIYQGLANSESAGAYLVGRLGLWHGGVHVTAAGFGRHIDLAAGVRCIADGEVVAYRINRRNLTSERPDSGGTDTTAAEYSTGFALVRHTMEFPKGKTLTFFSLYMHLMAYDDYQKPEHSSWTKPAYWPQQWEVTQYARDVPAKGRLGQTADLSQRGLRVRTRANGRILAILPQGARVTLDPIKGRWGKLKTLDLNGKSLIPSHADGYADSASISNGWISMGHEHGGSLVKEIVPDDVFETVQVPSTPIPIKMGDLVGHLGRYDKLEPGTGPNRQVHLETFTADDIEGFIEACGDWVTQHGAHKEDWAPLGLPSEPTILRIAAGTTLYERPGSGMPRGVEPQVGKTGVVQSYAMAALARDTDRTYTEPQVDQSADRKVTWWRVESADLRGNPIEGWVRDFNHTPGRVTREFPQKWVDFKCISDDHDTAHTIFADPASWVEFAKAPDAPGVASRSKLSPLMQQVYDLLFTEGNGDLAAIQLRDMSTVSGNGYAWLMQATSRLIVKHESEWAAPSKWAELFAALEAQTGPSAKLDEEKKRLEKLVWWEDVSKKILGFPTNAVFHINPIGLVSNFLSDPEPITMAMLAAADPSGDPAYHAQILPALNKYARGYNVTTPRRVAHFLSQISVESGFKNVEERLNYSERVMKRTYGCISGPKGSEKYKEVGGDVVCSFGRLREKLWTESKKYANNPKNLANYVYASRYENGDEDSGDGYKYRGRGLIQTTFKSNYRVLTKEHNRRFPNEPCDFIANPDLVLSNLEYGIESAFVYWSVTRDVNSIADSGSVSDVTKKVNGGLHGYAERKSAFNKLANILGILKDD